MNRAAGTGRLKRGFAGLVLLALIASGCNGIVTIGSLLNEMTSRESLTRFPEREFTHHQSSSYNRESVAPDKEGWFANSDMSHFIRIEQNDGRREFVMLDADGPGQLSGGG